MSTLTKAFLALALLSRYGSPTRSYERIRPMPVLQVFLSSHMLLPQWQLDGKLALHGHNGQSSVLTGSAFSGTYSSLTLIVEALASLA